MLPLHPPSPPLVPSPKSILRRAAALALAVVAATSGLLPSRGDAAAEASLSPILSSEALRRYVAAFNATDEELYPQTIRNADAAAYLEANAPRFECPDADIERTYWFRWWTFRKHLRQTSEGWVVTEFLPPVPWAGKHNTISCAAGHHFDEGRWLLNRRPLDDYARFWFRPEAEPRKYSFWPAEAILARARVTGDTGLARALLPDFVRNFEAWERDRFDPAVGLFWQEDGQDGMEVSVGGTGFRATLNTYLVAEASAIARIAELESQPKPATRFHERAERLRRTLLEKLWDPEARFFKVLPRDTRRGLADVRELHGFTPWYADLPEPAHAEAWRQFSDPLGFQAPFGLTTTEQRHPGFALSYAGHECQWNGPSWPYATAITLSAAANYLRTPNPTHLSVREYFDALRTYARAHRFVRKDGSEVPWIDENLNPRTGDWIARTRLATWSNGTWSAEKGGRERGKDYNHSTFCDLILSGLVGLRPRLDDLLEIHPLLPDGVWDFFAVDRIPYHGRLVTILWDRTGDRYRRGAGLRLLVDGRELASTNRLARLTATLPAGEDTAAEGRTGSRQNPATGKSPDERPETSSAIRYDPVPRDIEGWTVHVEPALVDGIHREEGARSLVLLANHLQRIRILVPPEPLTQLQTIEIWIEHDHPRLKSMQYHPSRTWLIEHGHDPRLARKVHITQARDLLSREHMLKHPAVVLHELAHGYHDQILGFDHPDILASYSQAVASGTYTRVLLFTGERVKHYALTDPKEYFAEGTEAYLYRNDFYPFVRAELKEHDPGLHDVLVRVWGPAK